MSKQKGPYHVVRTLAHASLPAFQRRAAHVWLFREVYNKSEPIPQRGKCGSDYVGLVRIRGLEPP